MLNVTRTEQGWPGHFVCADKCLFRRNTLLQIGEARVIVSTVGDMRNHRNEITSIGSDLYYETMVFAAEFQDGYWIAIGDPLPIPDSCRSSIDWFSLQSYKGLADHYANVMHECVVAHVSSRMTTLHEIAHGTGEGKPMGIIP